MRRRPRTANMNAARRKALIATVVVLFLRSLDGDSHAAVAQPPQNRTLLLQFAMLTCQAAYTVAHPMARLASAPASRAKGVVVVPQRP